MFEFDEVIEDLEERLDALTTEDDDLRLPSGKGNTLARLRLHHDDSCPSSNYNSDTDEPKCRTRGADRIDYEVQLDQDFISSNAVESKNRQRVGPDDFESLCILGCGAFGKVFLVKHKTSKSLYAMKVLRKASLVVNRGMAENAKTERQVLEDVRHPFIVKLFYAFQTQESLHMILEYAVGGEIFRHLEHEGMFSESMVSFYAAELVLALEHLHSLGIVYRDLKPENILLDAKGHVRLTDFGLSKVPVDGRTNTVCGTAEYMAPEILLGLEYDNTVDWWSLGILIYDMLTGSPPFSYKDQEKTIQSILHKKVSMPYYLSSFAKDLLSRLLRKDPNARLGAKPKKAGAVQRHAFFRHINWSALENGEVEPPIVPVVVGAWNMCHPYSPRDQTDPEAAENFDPAFTNLELASSPHPSDPIPHEIGHFHGFTFVDTSTLVAEMGQRS